MEIRVALGELVMDAKFGSSMKERMRAALKNAPTLPEGEHPELVIENSGGIPAFSAALIEDAQTALDAVLHEAAETKEAAGAGGGGGAGGEKGGDDAAKV